MREEYFKLMKAKEYPVSNMQDLNNKLLGTRDGFIYYTPKFRLDFDTKMAKLGYLESQVVELKEKINKMSKKELKIMQMLRSIELCTLTKERIDRIEEVMFELGDKDEN